MHGAVSHCYSQIWQLLQHVSLSFSEEAAKKLRVVLRCIFRCDFLSPRTTTASGVENYPSATVLRPLKSDF